MTTEEQRLKRNAAANRWYWANHEKALERNRRNKVKNGHKYVEKSRASYKAWRAANLERIKARELEYRKKHRKEACERERLRRLNDPEKKRAIDKAYREANREKINAYTLHRLATDQQFKLAFFLRKRLRAALHNNAKRGSAVRLLGCTVAELKTRIEAMFQPGMTWENWGKASATRKTWHLDHIIPLTAFDLTDPEQLKKACHFTNLQPLWAVDNIRKYNSIPSIPPGS